nr:glycosyltransferase family 1 protein [Blastococcus sp. PRF04-17]
MLVDATAVPADRGGVGRYVDELLPALVAEGADLAVAVQAHDVGHYRALLPGVDLLPAPAAAARAAVRFAWEQTGLPLLVRRSGADVLHSPHYTMPLAAGVPVVTTLHDATFFTHPDVHLAVKRTFFRAWTRTSLRRAARCVTPSAATRDELVRVAGARAERVDVAHLGVDTRRFHVPSAEERSAVRAHVGVDGPYVAFLGTLEPRKNAAGLVRGWVQAFAGTEDPPALVLAGGRGWDDEIDRAAAEVPRGLELHRPGYLPWRCWPGCSARQTSWPTRAWARVSVFRCWRPWRAGRPCSPPGGCHCRRWGVTPSPTPSPTRGRSPCACASCAPTRGSDGDSARRRGHGRRSSTGAPARASTWPATRPRSGPDGGGTAGP